MKFSYQRFKLWAPLVFWLFQIFIHIVRNIYRLEQISFLDLFQNIVITYPLDFISFCVFYFGFAPALLQRKKTWKLVSIAFIFLILQSGLWAVTYYFLGYKISGLKFIYFSSMGHTLLYAAYGLLLRIGIDWFQKRDEAKELEKQNVKTELALLRSQVNPHFLFNTLNNIHSFAQNDSAKSAHAIIKLSDIMRYMLYDANAEKVLLEKEIQHINNYLELQKMRFDNREFFTFKYFGITSGLMLPPMLFIPFVENAFKHGRKTEEFPIQIELKYKDNQIVFNCLNFKRPKSQSENEIPKGIGIRNIRRRLDILFPCRHRLDIQENEKEFSVKLILDL